MTRRTLAAPPDPRRDHALWGALVASAHQAAADGKAETLSQLAEAAIKARDLWSLPAPWPGGLVAKGFAALAVAFGRQTDPALRERLAPLMLASAGMVDELLSAAPMPVAEPVTAAPARLPYVD